MTFTLTNGQAQALTLIDRFLEDEPAPFMLLKGSAGTGKTHMTSLIPDKVTKGRVIGCAPTHKAVAVLQERLPDVECMTIHRFLGLRPKRTRDKTVLVQRNDYDPSANMDVAVVIFDEGSMSGSEITRYVVKDVEMWGRKYICVADWCQINPVGELTLPLFDLPFGPYDIELTEIVRQAEDNPIIKAATAIREAIRAGKEPRFLAGQFGHLGVHMLRREAFLAKIQEVCTDPANDDVDSFRVIAYKNDTVRMYNQLVRGFEGRDTSVPFEVGEWVVVNEAYTQDEDVILNTGVEFEVKALIPITHPVHDDLKGWLVTLRGEKGKPDTDVPVLDYESCGAAYKSRLSRLVENSKASGDWRPYYRLAEFWCDLRPLYALTSHKSQGSTFDNGFVDLRDIYSGGNRPAEADRCAYVAITRFRYNVYILV